MGYQFGSSGALTWYQGTPVEIYKLNVFLLASSRVPKRSWIVFVNMGPNGSEHFKTLKIYKTTNLKTNRSRKFANLSRFFLKLALTKLLCDVWNFESPIFNDFFSKISTSPLHAMEKPKPQLSGKRAIVDQNGVKFGTRGHIHDVHLALSHSMSFEVIRCTCDDCENTIFKMLLPHLWLLFSQTLCRCSLWQSTQKLPFGIWLSRVPLKC